MQPGFEPQRVARAETDRLDLARREQRASEPLRIFCGYRDFVAILAGVAGARDEALGTRDRKRAGAHERELRDLWRELRERALGERTLQRDERTIQRLEAEMRTQAPQQRDVFFLGRRVYHQAHFIHEARDHQV